MARRPSVISNGSLHSFSSFKPSHSANNLDAASVTSPGQTNGHAPPVLRSVSSSKLEQLLSASGTSSDLDPDDIFSKYTISEVRTVQRRLKSDADAKQEELRLMRRERYRDLLQASTSIISMSKSSQGVLDALADVREVISLTAGMQTSRRPSVEEDQRLRALQSLSAHLKLLLDTPEHLWRLLESKKYLHAAWLFLLARVVHRALVTEDDDGDQQWQVYGLEVSDQFPLVQRQWDTVSQFRSQITHKATLSLREHELSTTETCATLLTLHLLESRPLMETLAVYLAQRKKALSSTLSQFVSEEQPNGDTRPAGQAPKTSHRSRRLMVRATRQKLQTVLDIVSRTLGTARQIFSEACGRSMMKQVLEFIQAQSGSTPPPADLQLTTQILLSTLPSSSHFLLLPHNIISYRPYVDSASTSVAVSEAQLNQRLGKWYQQAMKDVESSLEKWLIPLETVNEIWDVRRTICTWLENSQQLNDSERVHAKSVVDEVCRRRLIAVWQSVTRVAETAFREQLVSCMAAIQAGSDRAFLDMQPAEYLYQTPPIPSLPQAEVNPSLASASLDQYRQALRQQLSGRTPLLQTVLDTAEGHIKKLEDELRCLQGGGDRTKDIVVDLVHHCRQGVASYYESIGDILNSTVADIYDSADSSIRSLVFIGRLAEEFSLSSTTISSGDDDVEVVGKFQQRMGALHRQVLDRWQDYQVSRAVTHSWNAATDGHVLKANLMAPRPSSALMQALFSLCTSLQQLGISVQGERQLSVAEQCLHRFLRYIIEQLHPQLGDIQAFWDLHFLRKIASASNSEALCSSIHHLEGEIQTAREKLVAEHLKAQGLDCEDHISDYFLRTQVLLSPLLPRYTTSDAPGNAEKAAILLPHGQPVIEQGFLPVMDLVKPSQRFGILLYGGNNFKSNPPKRLCAVQAAMVHGAPCMSVMPNPIYSELHEFDDSMIFRAVVAVFVVVLKMLLPPYVTFAIFSVAAGVVGARHPETIYVSNSIYCTIDNTKLYWAVPLFTAIILLGISCFEVAAMARYLKGWRDVKKLCPDAKTRAQEISPWIRAATFVLNSWLALGLSMHFFHGTSTKPNAVYRTSSSTTCGILHLRYHAEGKISHQFSHPFDELTQP
ncbi:hypothetical protein CERSUDRAFT_90499 [Gelatoporia subvermispora B]|uniref:Conserved oligomeric Golgi complex subunit 1 n=1 Tax=Ceriporiopsis subvermispora (strain B) TaxID=914234 RepID=M2QXS1_CERS8|nr:hypothetical protein CERSUDRAFT_90499 [Gelatoporia subvermispora B]